MTATNLRTIDRDLLIAIRRLGAAGIGDLTESLRVTATAIRQRIDRLIASDLIHREKVVSGRGRPTFRYRLTMAGQQAAGAKTSDLATALWHEVMAIDDPSIRERILSGVAVRMGSMFATELANAGEGNRLEQLTAILSARDVAIASVDVPGGLPVLDIEACPYPGLTGGIGEDVDRTMCKLEEKMFSEALGRPVHLSSCRLDGDSCCQFTAGDVASGKNDSFELKHSSSDSNVLKSDQ